MLDKLAPVLRDLALLVLGAVLTALTQWVGTDLTDVLRGWPAVAPFAGAIVTVLLAILTPLVRTYGTGSGKRGDHEAGRAGVAVAAVLALVATAALAAPAAAHRRAPAPVYVGVWAAHDCEGMLEVGYGTERLLGRTWGIVPDSWGADLQLHFVGNGAAEGGQWETVPARWRTEGRVAAVVAGLPTWDSARIVLHVEGGDVVSSGRPAEGCEA